jgi:hypothetical protein
MNKRASLTFAIAFLLFIVFDSGSAGIAQTQPVNPSPTNATPQSQEAATGQAQSLGAQVVKDQGQDQTDQQVSEERHRQLKALSDAQQAAADAYLNFVAQHPRDDKNKASFNKSNQQGWAYVNTQCADSTKDVCAAAAIIQFNAECSASAKFFKKDTRVWNIISFSMVVASGVFTAVGASTTLANAKIFSTLGGTTGLGAVSASANTNVGNDQNALIQLNTAVDAFLKFVETGGANSAPAPNDMIYKVAPIYAEKCSSAANASQAKS